MALPAGRRGIRANLVKSDGSIDNSSIEDEISDLEEDLTELNGVLSSLLGFKVFSASYTIDANAGMALGWTQLGVSIPEGYSIVGMRAVDVGNTEGVVLRSANPAHQTSTIKLRNLTSSAITATASISILFAKTSCIATL